VHSGETGSSYLIRAIAYQLTITDYPEMLKEKQKKALRKIAHSRKPVVLMGNAGLTEGVLAALDEALDTHELVKVKVAAGDRTERDQIVLKLVEHSESELIQRVGNIATLFRRNPSKPVISL
jgi:RNA-binding protein